MFRCAVQLRPERVFWRLRCSTVGPLVFGGNEEIEAYRAGISQTLDCWLASPPPRAAWNDLLFADAFPIFNLAYHGRNNLELKRKIAAVYEPYFRDQPEPTGSGNSARKRIGVVVTQRHEGNFLRTMTGVWRNLDGNDFELVVFLRGPPWPCSARGFAATTFVTCPFPRPCPRPSSGSAAWHAT